MTTTPTPKKPSELIATARDALIRFVDFYFAAPPETKKHPTGGAKLPQFSIPARLGIDSDLILSEFFEAGLTAEVRANKLEVELGVALAELDLEKRRNVELAKAERAKFTSMHRRAQAAESRAARLERVVGKRDVTIDALRAEVASTRRILDTYATHRGPMISVEDARDLIETASYAMPDGVYDRVRTELREYIDRATRPKKASAIETMGMLFDQLGKAFFVPREDSRPLYVWKVIGEKRRAATPYATIVAARHAAMAELEVGTVFRVDAVTYVDPETWFDLNLIVENSDDVAAADLGLEERPGFSLRNGAKEAFEAWVRAYVDSDTKWVFEDDDESTPGADRYVVREGGTFEIVAVEVPVVVPVPIDDTLRMTIAMDVESVAVGADGSIQLGRPCGSFDVFVDPGPFPVGVRRSIETPELTAWIRNALVSLGARDASQVLIRSATWDGAGVEPNVLLSADGVDWSPAEVYAQRVFQESIRVVLGDFAHRLNDARTHGEITRRVEMFVRGRLTVLEAFVGRTLAEASWSVTSDAGSPFIRVRVDLEPNADKGADTGADTERRGSDSEVSNHGVSSDTGADKGVDTDADTVAETPIDFVVSDAIPEGRVILTDLVEQVAAVENVGTPRVDPAVETRTEIAQRLGDLVFVTMSRIGTKEFAEAVDFLDPNANRFDDTHVPYGYEIARLLECLSDVGERAGLEPKRTTHEPVTLPKPPTVREFYVVFGRVDGIRGYVGMPRGGSRLAVWLEPTHPSLYTFVDERGANDFARRHNIDLPRVEKVRIETR